jgi:DNA-binding LytR/AlgR family response regulator
MIATNSSEQLERDGEGGFVALLRDGAKVKVSRTYAMTFRENIS